MLENVEFEEFNVKLRFDEDILQMLLVKFYDYDTRSGELHSCLLRSLLQ